MIDQSRLKQVLHYDPRTGEFIRRITLSSRAIAGSRVGAPNSEGYRFVKIDGILYRCHRLAWLYVTGEWPENQIDHINGNRADNRFENLREATTSQNSHNRRGPNVDNRSGALGVCWHKAAKKWHARIAVECRRIDLGFFDDFADAVSARRAAEKKHYGEFAPQHTACQR